MDHVLQSPYDGPGIIVFSMGRCCSETYMLKDGEAKMNFCLECQKKTFAIKYPDSQLTRARVFYGRRRECYNPHMIPGDEMWARMMRSVVCGNGAIFSLFLDRCCHRTFKIESNKMSFSFCAQCQQRNSFLKKTDRVI